MLLFLLSAAVAIAIERRYSLFIHTPLQTVPFFKKLAYIVGIAYSVLLLIMIVASKEDIRTVVEYIYPETKQKLVEKDYVRDCSVNFFENFNLAKQNIEEILYDKYFLCHLLGYIPFTLLFRDYTTLWIKSLAFELVEISLQYQMPNFKECWWDHYVIDVLICNAGGIFLGMQLIRFMNWRSFPKIFTKELLKYPLQMCQSLFLVYLLLHNELMTFCNKYIFNIEAFHPINMIRLVIMACFGYVGSQDYYENIILKEKSSTDFWKIVVLVTMLEEAFVWKYSEIVFSNTTPEYVSLPLQMSLTLFIIWCSLWALFRREIENRKLYRVMNFLFFSSFIPAMALMIYGI